MINNFIKDFVKYLPAQIVPALVGFLSIPIITKSFPPDQYGNYSLVVASIAVLMTLAGWIPTSIIRFFSAFDGDRQNIFIKTTIILAVVSNLAICLFAYLMLISFSKYISSDLSELFYVGLICFLLDSFFLTLQYFLRARRDVKFFTFYVVSQNFLNLIFIILVVFLNLTIVYLLYAKIFTNIILLPFLRKTAIRIKTKIFINGKFSSVLMKEMFFYSSPLVIGNLAAWILNLSDRYILEFYRGAREVGIYSASYNVADKTVMLFNNLFMFAAGPIAMIVWEKQGVEKSKEFTAKISRYFILLGVPLCFFISVLSKPLMVLLTTKEYSVGSGIIPLVVFGVLLLGLQQSFQNGFLFYKKTSKITLAVVISAALNLVLNVLFVPKFGYIAAAVSTLFCYIVLLCLMIFLSRRVFTWKFPFKSLINSFFASALSIIVTFFVSIHLINFTLSKILVLTILHFVAYAFILLLAREFSDKEIKTVREVILKYAHISRKL